MYTTNPQFHTPTFFLQIFSGSPPPCLACRVTRVPRHSIVNYDQRSQQAAQQHARTRGSVVPSSLPPMLPLPLPLPFAVAVILRRTALGKGTSFTIDHWRFQAFSASAFRSLDQEKAKGSGSGPPRQKRLSLLNLYKHFSY